MLDAGVVVEVSGEREVSMRSQWAAWIRSSSAIVCCVLCMLFVCVDRRASQSNLVVCERVIGYALTKCSQSQNSSGLR